MTEEKRWPMWLRVTTLAVAVSVGPITLGLISRNITPDPPTPCQVYIEFNRLAKMVHRERIALPEYCEKYKDQE